MIRAFIAIRLAPAAALGRLLDRLASFGRPVRTVAPQNLHATLRFLGDIDPAITDAIGDAIRAAAADCSPFELHLEGLGAFGRPTRPSVIWVGMHQTQPLETIIQKLDPALDAIAQPPPELAPGPALGPAPALPPRDRPFRPHLTVARVKAKPPEDLLALLETNAATDYGTAVVNCIQLVQSKLSPTGPTYTDLHTIELAGNAH